MKTLTKMRAEQMAKFARYLEEHPGLSPELFGEDAWVVGFRVGDCLLSVEDMETMIDTPVDQQTAALLTTADIRRTR